MSQTESDSLVPVNFSKIGSSLLRLLLVSVVVGVVGALFFWLVILKEVKQNEIGYLWDRRTGEITVLPRSGYFMTIPFVKSVHSISTSPEQVCINANSRVLNCKLVEFNPVGLKLFLSWHGLQDGNVSEILKSYAYDGQNKSYPFLTIKTELGAQSTVGTRP